MKKSRITGVTGQDGAYLAEFPQCGGHEVHGIKSCTSLFNTNRIDHLCEISGASKRKLILHHGDIADSSSHISIQQIQPDEINLAAQLHVAASFDPAKARPGWTPKVTFDEMVGEMARDDLKSAERGQFIRNMALEPWTIESR